MITHSQQAEFAGEEYYTIVDETIGGTFHLCPAEDEPFEPCGKRMRKHKDGSYYCSDHGEMH